MGRSEPDMGSSFARLSLDASIAHIFPSTLKTFGRLWNRNTSGRGPARRATMNKPVLGLVLGGILGILQVGLSVEFMVTGLTALGVIHS